MVRAQRRAGLRRLLDRDLRRGPHRAGREDQRLHPQLAGPGVHRHDRDRRPDRPPRRRPLPDPDLALRPRPGGAPRRDRAASLHPHPARPGRADDRQGAAAQGRGRPGLRPGGAGQAARPGAVQRRDRRPLPVALPALPGVVYTAGVKHANNVAEAFQDAGINARAVSGETPKRELAEILAAFERGEVDVLCNAMLLAEGWNSPRATICMHLAPTASRRVYQQRVGRVTRRAPGKEAGPGHRLRPPGDHPRRDDRHPAQPARPRRLPRRRDRRRPGSPRPRPPGPGRAAHRPRLRRPRAAPAGPRARDVADRGREPRLLRAARLGGARRRPRQRRRLAPGQGDAPARPAKELRRRFLLTCVQRNRNPQLRLKALAEIAALRDPEAFDDAVLIFTAAELARRHRAAGLALNAPEAIALICDAMLEAARAGAVVSPRSRRPGSAAVAPDEVIDGVRELVDEVRLEVLVGDGTRLVVLVDPLGRGRPPAADGPGAIRAGSSRAGHRSRRSRATHDSAVRNELAADGPGLVPLSVRSGQSRGWSSTGRPRPASGSTCRPARPSAGCRARRGRSASSATAGRVARQPGPRTGAPMAGRRTVTRRRSGRLGDEPGSDRTARPLRPDDRRPDPPRRHATCGSASARTARRPATSRSGATPRTSATRMTQAGRAPARRSSTPSSPAPSSSTRRSASSRPTSASRTAGSSASDGPATRRSATASSSRSARTPSRSWPTA